eukprot:CAMPEP_0195294460 /NCGR_PEP_ID=MMETSP0707-20130614/15060_1 /TAXON_ID=33640 /ORGANISM="Asterionellopsis glacialis, Strain CCMP134" /LENGTH=266 /DNA_ID=CAMNT_0040355441 /DNA_START=42 /DNA_END=842 /DNA_ORIENTATION=-
MPSQAEPPRRSSRRPKPKKYSSYNVGDVVEIARNNVIVRGKLAYKLSEGPTANPRWLVTFVGETWKDEELYERSFGKVLQKANEDGSDNVSTAPAQQKSFGGRNSKKLKNGHSGSNNKSSSTSSQKSKSNGGTSGRDEDLIDRKKKKMVAFSEAGSPMASDNNGADSSSPLTDGKVSAREQRSLRRQAMIQEDAPLSLPDEKSHKKKRSLEVLLNKCGNGSKAGPNCNHGNKRPRKDEEVVKIPMNTGTLYLHRGLHRRATFVRRS